MSTQHGSYRQIPAPRDQNAAPKRSKRAKKAHKHGPGPPSPRDPGRLATDFWRTIRQLNGALDGRRKPVDQQRVKSLEGQLDRIVRDWEAAEAAHILPQRSEGAPLAAP